MIGDEDMVMLWAVVIRAWLSTARTDRPEAQRVLSALDREDKLLRRASVGAGDWPKRWFSKLRVFVASQWSDEESGAVIAGAALAAWTAAHESTRKAGYARLAEAVRPLVTVCERALSDGDDVIDAAQAADSLATEARLLALAARAHGAKHY